jgi:hypothetical protein
MGMSSDEARDFIDLLPTEVQPLEDRSAEPKGLPPAVEVSSFAMIAVKR